LPPRKAKEHLIAKGVKVKKGADLQTLATAYVRAEVLRGKVGAALADLTQAVEELRKAEGSLGMSFTFPMDDFHRFTKVLPAESLAEFATDIIGRPEEHLIAVVEEGDDVDEEALGRLATLTDRVSALFKRLDLPVKPDASVKAPTLLVPVQDATVTAEPPAE
jgi:hypothetical protein